MFAPRSETATSTDAAIGSLEPRRLSDHIRAQLPELGEPGALVRLEGGQSNPTFLLAVGEQKVVVRKRPAGKLLDSAHRIDREYQVMKALSGKGVPVPHMLHHCADVSVMGTEFFVMQFVDGRIEADPRFPSFSREDRTPLQLQIARTLAHLHAVDWRAAGLGDFGRAENYVARQVKTWTRQYKATQTEALPAMDSLGAWLLENLPPPQEPAVVHGDYRPGNMIFEQQEPRIAAILDWELSTIGDPLADLGYYLMPWFLPAGIEGIRGVIGAEQADSLAAREEIVEAYRVARGLHSIPDVTYYVALSMFRLAAILQGVYARALAGNANSSNAARIGQRAGYMASAGWALVGGA